MSDAENIVPFGKYKGKPIEALAQDRAYLDWLTAQAWFRERYANFYTLIINNFREPTETPEHNALQALFLDRSFYQAFGKRWVELRFSNVPKERWPTFPDEPHITFEEGCDVRLHIISVEIKPTVSDDYPAVLRQMRAARANTLFLETYTGVGATEEQFIKIFNASEIEVIFRREIVVT